MRMYMSVNDSEDSPNSASDPEIFLKGDRLNKTLPISITRVAVALQYFPSRRHRNDRLNIQHLIFKKKGIFERKKSTMEVLMEEFKPM